MTNDGPQPTDDARLKWFWRNVVGLGVGIAATIYGLFGLVARHAWLPGLRGNNHTANGLHAVAIALIYLTGGLYLVCRLFMHTRPRRRTDDSLLYLGEVGLLVVLIGSLLYVLLKVGSAG